MACPTKPCFDLLLLGKTGHGKSATGNSILGSKTFKVSSSSNSVTSDVSVSWTERDNCLIKVIDSPGIGETRLDKKDAVEKAVEDFSKAMTMSTEGFHALLVVYKFNSRFTEEEQGTIDFLKDMLGKEVFKKYGVCVMTDGDGFRDAMEDEETPQKTPLVWCREQKNNFSSLVEECGDRLVMFQNRSKDQKIKHDQVEELVQLLKALPNHERYTNAQFEQMHEERKKLIIKAKLPQMEEAIQRDCSLLKESFERIDLDNADAPGHVADLKRKASQLIKDIDEKDQETGVLQPLKTKVKSVFILIEKYEAAQREKDLEKRQKEIEKMKQAFEEEKKKFNEEFDGPNLVYLAGTFSAVLLKIGLQVFLNAAIEGLVPVLASTLTERMKTGQENREFMMKMEQEFHRVYLKMKLRSCRHRDSSNWDESERKIMSWTEPRH